MLERLTIESNAEIVDNICTLLSSSFVSSNYGLDAKMNRLVVFVKTNPTACRQFHRHISHVSDVEVICMFCVCV
jgi:hypothetical protein